VCCGVSASPGGDCGYHEHWRNDGRKWPPHCREHHADAVYFLGHWDSVLRDPASFDAWWECRMKQIAIDTAPSSEHYIAERNRRHAEMERDVKRVLEKNRKS
jgi:hypothetical protein